MARRVLVTGASGFVGRHLVSELLASKKYTPVCFFRGKHSEYEKELLMLHPDIEIIHGDITKKKDVEKAVKGVSAVVHLAASVHSFDTKRNYDVNVNGAKNLVAACKKQKVKRVIFASTFLATKEKKFQDNYGYTKQQSEAVFKKASHLDLTILRFTLVYGLGGKGFTKMVNNVKGLPLVIPLMGSGNRFRQPVWIGDITKAVLVCLSTRKSVGKEYYLGGPSTITFKEMMQVISKQLGVKKILVPIPIWSLKIMASILEKVLPKSPITNRDIISMNQDTSVDISAAKKDLDHNPVSFSVGVQKTLEFVQV